MILIFVSCFFLMMGNFFKMVTHLSGDAWSLGTDSQKPHVTILNVEGPIIDPMNILKQIEKIKSREKCRGVLVRIESPGGAVAASQEIYHALKNLRGDEFPVVISMGNTAASGGYYIALAGNRIFSNPGTLTGSIGVIAQFPMAEDLMKKVGITFSTIKSGSLKDAGSPFKKATQKELEYFQEMIDGTYSQFIDDVLLNREISKKNLLEVADGRVFTGKHAQEIGLVDTLGGLLDAKAYIAELTKLGEDPIFVEPTTPSSWVEHLGSKVNSLGQPFESRVKELFRSGIFYIWSMGNSLDNY